MTAPSRLLIIGAAGRTGRILTQLAVTDGHTVTTLTRSPLPATGPAEPHRQITGDARDPAALARALDGQDAVICVVAAPNRKPTTMVSDLTRALLEAMAAADVHRLVMTSSRNLAATRPWLTVALTRWVFRHVYTDLERAEALVRDSDRAWTLVRATMLSDDPARGGAHIDTDDDATGGDWRLPRADYARVLLSTALDDTAVGRVLGVNGLRSGSTAHSP